MTRFYIFLYISWYPAKVLNILLKNVSVWKICCQKIKITWHKKHWSSIGAPLSAQGRRSLDLSEQPPWQWARLQPQWVLLTLWAWTHRGRAKTWASYQPSTVGPGRQLCWVLPLADFGTRTLYTFLSLCIQEVQLPWIYVLVALWTREGDGTPLQYSCLENPMDGGAW